MKIYLAHNYSARFWLREEVVPKLQAAGYEVCSSWVFDPVEMNEAPGDSAGRDLGDLCQSDIFIFFADQYGEIPGRGKFIEFGYAMGISPTVIIGSKKSYDSCVFFALADEYFETVDSFLENTKLEEIEQ